MSSVCGTCGRPVLSTQQADRCKCQQTELVEGEDYEINENGDYVFTRHYHLKRGYCCQNGCKNCPYSQPI